MSQVPNRARLGLCLPRAQECMNASCALGKHPLHPTLQAASMPYQHGLTMGLALGLALVLILNSGLPRASHSQ